MLQTIERIKETVRLTALPPVVVETLRFEAQIRSTHYSTAIEGNRLTLKETELVVQHRQPIPGRERDVLEVERYYRALQQMEKWVAGGRRSRKSGFAVTKPIFALASIFSKGYGSGF